MRKELVDLIHEAMEQHELARDFYHRLAHRMSHAETREARAAWLAAQRSSGG